MKKLVKQLGFYILWKIVIVCQGVAMWLVGCSHMFLVWCYGGVLCPVYYMNVCAVQKFGISKIFNGVSISSRSSLYAHQGCIYLIQKKTN